MGLCMYSPPVNKNGNSVRGLHFCQVGKYDHTHNITAYVLLIILSSLQRLVETFNFHVYDSAIVQSNRIDPRKYREAHKVRLRTAMGHG